MESVSEAPLFWSVSWIVRASNHAENLRNMSAVHGASEVRRSSIVGGISRRSTGSQERCFCNVGPQ